MGAWTEARIRTLYQRAETERERARELARVATAARLDNHARRTKAATLGVKEPGAAEAGTPLVSAPRR